MRRAIIRLEKEFVRNCMVRETFSMNKVADDWNKLSNEVVEAKTVNGFEARYGKFTTSQKATIA